VTRFGACLPVVQKWEGGWADHPHDNGGATMKGVTQRVYQEYKQRPVTKEELRNITDAEVRDIFKAGYWDTASCDSFRAGVDLVVFDAAVNSGPRRSIRWLQMAIGAVADGIVGPETRWKASQMDPLDIIAKATDLRMAFLRDLDDWPHFGRGWTNRVNDVRAEAIKMARADTGSVSVAGTQQDGRLLRAYRLAKAEIGTKEIAGPASNPEIDDWFAKLGFSYMDDTAWCAAFVGAMLEASGLRSTRALNARSYMEWGEPTLDPQEGDLVVFWRVSRRDWRGHVGFFVRREGDKIITLGGNQNDQVSEKAYPISANTYGLLGYRTMRVPIEQENDMALVDQPTSAPTRKLTWASVAALVSASLTPWLMETIPFLSAFNETDLESMVATAIVTVATFATGYFVRERA
jgi:uncharacterized protein (TIGR02594 family)